MIDFWLCLIPAVAITLVLVLALAVIRDATCNY